jgi:8-oxo-dGTP pyrophosphatase MutT (NUDIX family)
MATKTKKSAKGASATQTVIQINIYRYKAGKLQFLLFKRIDEDNDHFWQPISLAAGEDEPIDETLKKAAEQQAGISELHYLGQELYSYEWYSHGQRGRDIVFAAEVAPQTLVFPDLKQHSKFAWMPYKEALLKLTWDGNKKSLRQLMDHLEKREEEQEKQEKQPPAASPEPQTEQTSPATPQRDQPRDLSKKPPDPAIPYDHQSTKDLSDELMPNYNDEDDDSARIFPL